MTDLTPDHPAVERGLEAHMRHAFFPSQAPTSGREKVHDILAAALPHLTADDLRHTPAGRELMAEAWEDGAQAAWGESGEGWNGEYTGRSGPPGAFREHNPTLPNPYEEAPNE